MNLRTALLLSVSLVACGQRTDVVTTQADCLTFHSPGPLNADALEFNVRLARKSMAPIVPVDQFCGAFRDTYIEVNPVDSWDCEVWNAAGQLACLRGYTGINGVDLNQDIDSLAHELIHVWDFAHGDLLSSNHHGWEESGRNAIEREYYAGHQDPRP